MTEDPMLSQSETHIWEEPISILLVDDDEEDFLITRDILSDIRDTTYLLTWVESYEEAVEALQQNRYDVYLIDYRLGGRTGLELIKEALDLGCQSPMILLTGVDDLETDTRAMQLGAADFLVKSQINADQLGRSIRYSLQQSRNLIQIRHLNLDLEARVAARTSDLARAIEELRQTQQLYVNIASQFPHGFIMVLDRQLHLLLLDGQDLRNLSLDPQQLLGQKGYVIVCEDKQPVMKYYLNRVIEGESLSFEFDIDHDSYAFKGVPLTNSAGDIDQILVASINITQQKRVEAEIRNTLSKEKQLNELKSRFIAMASHEFRTPLSAILSSVSLIGRYTQVNEQPKRDKHIDRIKANVSNLTGILDDFLSLSKLEEGKVESNPVWIELEAFLQDVCEEMHSLAKPGQSIVLHYQGDPEIYLDKRLLKNILLNLLSNATKYSPPHTSIEVTGEVNPHFIRICVQDHGIGIPEEEQGHLFERFYRAHNATNIQGTGLGLNIVQKYVSLMEGKVDFHSVLNEGTAFTITFPRKFPQN